MDKADAARYLMRGGRMDDRERQYRSMLLDVRGDIDHAWYKAYNTHHPTLAAELKEASERITTFLEEMAAI